MPKINFEELEKRGYKPYNVTFDEKRHIYWLGADKLTGVTTILKQKNKPQLIAWASKVACEFISKNFDWTIPYTKATLAELLALAKNAHVHVSQEALDTGKIAHECCEGFILTGEMVIPKQFNGVDLTEKQVKEVMNCTNAFLQWVKDYKPNFWASEMAVCSKDWMYAGTLDWIAEIKGEIFLGDIKTSEAIYEDYILQLAGYQVCLEECGFKPEKRSILRLDKSKPMYEYFVCPTDIEFDKEVFLGFKRAHQWDWFINNKVKKSFKGSKYKKIIGIIKEYEI